MEILDSADFVHKHENLSNNCQSSFRFFNGQYLNLFEKIPLFRKRFDISNNAQNWHRMRSKFTFHISMVHFVSFTIFPTQCRGIYTKTQAISSNVYTLYNFLFAIVINIFTHFFRFYSYVSSWK